MSKKIISLLFCSAIIGLVFVVWANPLLAAKTRSLTSPKSASSQAPSQTVTSPSDSSVVADAPNNNSSSTAAGSGDTEADSDIPPAQASAEAIVTKILAENNVKMDDGSISKQQNLELKMTTGPLAGQIEQYIGISDLQVTNDTVYKTGDRVIVGYNKDQNGNYVFYVNDYVRSNALFWLLLLFIAFIILVGKWKGFRAILSFFLSFLFIIYVMVPLFLLGWNALAIGFLGSIIILLLIIYLTEGFNRKAHIAALGITVSLAATAVLSMIFVATNHLTGTASDDVTYLIGASSHALDYKNLLLAAMFIGILGLLDDIVIGQVEAVLQIKKANPYLNVKKVFDMSFKVGQSHLGAIINTLFLAYISTALPLVLLISLHQQPYASLSDIINNELVATDIVRTLVGVVGLCSAIPISTWLAAKYLKVVPEKSEKDKKI